MRDVRICNSRCMSVWLFRPYLSHTSRGVPKEYKEIYNPTPQKMKSWVRYCMMIHIYYYDPCLLWPNGWMDQGATWCGGRPRFKLHCVRRGLSSALKGAQQPPTFLPTNSYRLRPKRHDLTLTIRRDSRNFFQRLLVKNT